METRDSEDDNVTEKSDANNRPIVSNANKLSFHDRIII